MAWTSAFSVAIDSEMKNDFYPDREEEPIYIHL